MTGSPIRWLAVLAVLVPALTGLPARAGPMAEQPPATVNRQVPSKQIPPAEMPDLVGLSLQAARNLPVVVKYRLELVPERFASDRPRDTIVGQSVPRGRPVRLGARVVVDVADGLIEVPLVEGRPIGTALAMLKEFRVEQSPVPANRQRPGFVARQSLQPRTRRPRGSLIRLDVTADTGPELTRVPGVIGDREGPAVASVESSRLRPRVTRVPRPGERGIVVDQKPGRGAQVPVDSVVELLVSIPLPVDPQKPRDPQPVLVVVPDVRGLSMERAAQVLARARLHPRVVGMRPADAPPGTVLEQDPAPNTRVRPDSEIELVGAERLRIDPQPPTYDMPNLVGRTVDDALADAMVRRIKLRIASRDDPKAGGTPGLIVRQSIPAGAAVTPGTPVTVWVPTGVVVPNLVGLAAQAARDRLGEAGLQARVREVVRDRDDGQVVSQIPQPNSVVPLGEAVEIAVAVLEMVTVPDVGGQPRLDALRLLKSGRLNGAAANDSQSTLAPDRVSGQDPAPGTRVAVGTVVRIRVAAGVEVPSVIGTTIDDARARLTSSGLNAESREVRTSRTAANAVFEQVPPAGQRVARGSRVVVSVARAPLVPVPDVRRRQSRDSLRLLAEAQLKGEVTDEPASPLDPGLVVTQEPAPGQQVEIGTIVRLRAAMGVVVPAVVGVMADAARARVEAGGLGASLSEVRTSAAAAGTVFEQRPRAGERVARGTVMELVVARPPMVTVPDLTRQTRDDATSVTKTAGLGIVFEDDVESTAPPNRVTRQDPPANSSVEMGSIVRATVAIGVSVPSVVSRQATTARATIAAAGLRVDEQTEMTDSVPEATVLRQSPEANALVARGSLIRLVVAARRTVAVPNLVGRSRNEIEGILGPIPLQPSFEESPTADATVVGSVIGQEPGAEARVGPGSLVRVVIGVAQPIPIPSTTTVPGLAVPTTAPTTVLPTTSDAAPDGAGTLAPFVPWIVGLSVFSLLIYRVVKANRESGVTLPVEPVVRDDLVLRGTLDTPIEQKPPEPPPTPQVTLDPHQDQAAIRLEVSGAALIQFEVRIRTGADIGEQSLSHDEPLVGEEKRIYE
jgi:beta-lactam-binding protein with PASTA domain